MKFKRNLLILSAILIGVLIVVAGGCMPAPTTPPAEEGDVPSDGSIYIAHGNAVTNDTTPPLSLYAKDADYMAFSGDGTTWSSWITYATSYSLFNITTGAGCTSGDGTKKVYVKFKNDAGESTKIYDSIVLDTVAPKLSSVVYTDVNISGTVNNGDKITFTFDDEMLTSTVTSTNVATSLPLSVGNYGTGATISWDTTLKICTVTLGTSPIIISGTTVNPASSVTDIAGNADNSSAVTIITVVTPVTPPTPLVDPDKLSVSAQNQNAKYTSLPAGATVKVYSNAANDAAAAQAAGVKANITSSNTWTPCPIGVTDYIFFTMTDSGGWTSPITADGQIPTAPDVTALGSIQATSKNTVTSSVDGNVTGNDKITLYVGGIAYSAATSVGSTMTVTTDLVAGNQPMYTRTNPDGHESVISGADGKILILHTAVGTGGAVGVIENADILTLKFWDATTDTSVDVNVPITISNISWVASAGTAALDNGTGTLANTGTNVASVVLIATANCTDFAALETVDFNILPNTPIVDNAGGNQVLPAATATTFTDGTDF